MGGVLQPIASKVLIKVIYAARMCRYDLLRATCALESKVTKWNTECDKQLHRLVCYIHSSLDVHLVGWIGDGVKAMELKLSVMQTLPVISKRADQRRACSCTLKDQRRSSHSQDRARSRAASATARLRLRSWQPT